MLANEFLGVELSVMSTYILGIVKGVWETFRCPLKSLAGGLPQCHLLLGLAWDSSYLHSDVQNRCLRWLGWITLQNYQFLSIHYRWDQKDKFRLDCY